MFFPSLNFTTISFLFSGMAFPASIVIGTPLNCPAFKNAVTRKNVSALEFRFSHRLAMKSFWFFHRNICEHSKEMVLADIAKRPNAFIKFSPRPDILFLPEPQLYFRDIFATPNFLQKSRSPTSESY